MKKIKILLFALIFLSLNCKEKTIEKNSNTISIVKIWTDKQGESHFGTYEVELKNKGNIGSISNLIPGTGIMFRTTPANYDFSWHVAPRKQFIVNLDAAVEITVSDGETKTINAGEVFLLEDTWGKGHYSKSVGEKERTSLFIPVED